MYPVDALVTCPPPPLQPSPFPWPSIGPNPFAHCRFSEASLTGLSALLHPLTDADALTADRKSGELWLAVRVSCPVCKRGKS
jgi:hypothetical protein